MLMTAKGRRLDVWRRRVVGAVFIALCLIVLVQPALAGTDATFSTALNKFTGFLQGSGGKIITVISLASGIIAMARGGFSLEQVAIPVGVGVGVGTGVPIVTSTITALI